MVQPTALVLTELQLQVPSVQRFVVVVSPEFSALLQGDSLDQSSLCQIGLTFDPDAIATFLSTSTPSHSVEVLPNLQSDFTIQLIELLGSEPPAPTVPALRQQIEQERLMNEVTSLIRQSLELPVILESAVQHLRQFLQVDRLIIYQFDTSAPTCLFNEDQLEAAHTTPTLDAITYESRRNLKIPSILHTVEEFNPQRVQQIREFNRTQLMWAIEDCTTFPVESLPLPPTPSTRAELVMPIFVQDELWGLLIAHECTHPRTWQVSEKIFMQRIAEHLAIAIYQAKLYSELQSQTETLEQQVIERTQELRDTLISAQSASRAKSEFLATMSHELRSPLTTIIGMAATLLRYYDVSATAKQSLPLAKQQDYLRTIQTRGEHLLALINDILELSRVEAGKTVLQVREFSLTQVVYQTVQLLQEKADAKRVTLKIELPSRQTSMPPFLRFHADPQRVQQILFNLLSNAIKFTPEGGQVTLQVVVQNRSAVLRVTDTGIGISEEQRSLLFQKFQQLDASIQRKYEGTGLGLALTKQLVDLHGGSIEVESKVKVGSTFTVYLPAQPLSAIEHAREKTPHTDELLHPCIVLIEDDEETATLICDLLTAADYQVVWMMESAVTAKQIELMHPAMVILDLSQPNGGRDALIRHLQNSMPVRILALTVDHCDLAIAVDDCLAKPITQPELLIDKVAALVKP
jgi:two-component system, sensor histidine kinase and response regulator